MQLSPTLRLSLVLTTLLLVAGSPALAATAPAAFITWQTNTVVPLGYAGKVLPNRTAPITAAVFAITGGSVADLRKISINWYANNEFIAGGVGMTRVTVPAEDPPSKSVVIRATLKQLIPPDDLSVTTTVPRTLPIVVVTPPMPEILRSSKLLLRVIPYFFTATEGAPLEYSWQVNGRIRSVADDILVLDTSQADRTQTVAITTTGTNPQNSLELGTAELILTIP